MFLACREKIKAWICCNRGKVGREERKVKTMKENAEWLSTMAQRDICIGDEKVYME